MLDTIGYTLPEPVQGYPLPGGGMASTEQEWFEKVTENQARELVEAYVYHNGGRFKRGQQTRNINILVPMLVWQAVITASGEREQKIAEYREYRDNKQKEAEKAAAAAKEASAAAKREQAASSQEGSTDGAQPSSPPSAPDAGQGFPAAPPV